MRASRTGIACDTSRHHAPRMPIGSGQMRAAGCESEAGCQHRVYRARRQAGLVRTGGTGRWRRSRNCPVDRFGKCQRAPISVPETVDGMNEDAERRRGQPLRPHRPLLERHVGRIGGIERRRPKHFCDGADDCLRPDIERIRSGMLQVPTGNAGQIEPPTFPRRMTLRARQPPAVSGPSPSPKDTTPRGWMPDGASCASRWSRTLKADITVRPPLHAFPDNVAARRHAGSSASPWPPRLAPWLRARFMKRRRASNPSSAG